MCAQKIGTLRFSHAAFLLVMVFSKMDYVFVTFRNVKFSVFLLEFFDWWKFFSRRLSPLSNQ